MIAWLVEIWDWLTSIRAGARQAKQRHIDTLEGTVTALKTRLDFAEASAVLKNVQAHQALVETTTAARFEQQKAQLVERATSALEQLNHTYGREYEKVGFLLVHMLPFLYPGLRQALIEAADLPPALKVSLLQLADDRHTYIPITDEESLAQLRLSPLYGALLMPGPGQEDHEGS